MTLEFVRSDTLADPIGALPVDPVVNLAALPVGRCEDGTPWLLRLLGSHVLIAGATGSGKGSVIWSAVRAMLPAILGGWVQVWALDPKRMELSFGRDLFTRYADTAAAMVGLLEDAVTEMHDRAAKFGGPPAPSPPRWRSRSWSCSIDELAFLTAYQPDRDLRKRAEAAIATLTSQGRSVGVCVVGALQDPRKDVISLRNLFPTRIALRLDESDQVDMVLGDGARDRGALADEISPTPETGAGVGYVRLEGSPQVGPGPGRLRGRRRTSAPWPRGGHRYEPPRTVSRGRSDRTGRVAHRRAVPGLRGRAVPGRPRRTRAGRRVPAVRLVRTLGPDHRQRQPERG